MSYKKPTDYYDDRVSGIDEEICFLIQERKKVSNGHPGYPPLELISNWSSKYGLVERFLQVVFRNVYNEESFLPEIVPEGFRKHITVMQVEDVNDVLFSVTYVRQFQNASVINLNLDWDFSHDDPYDIPFKFFTINMSFGSHYKVRQSDGGGNSGHRSYKFIVTPPLPDDFSGYRMKVEGNDKNKDNEAQNEGLHIVWEKV